MNAELKQIEANLKAIDKQIAKIESRGIKSEIVMAKLNETKEAVLALRSKVIATKAFA